jgi:replicative DNA helicase
MKNRKDATDPILYGKIPPQAIDLEVAVLGAIILESYIFDEVRDLIDSENVFYKDEHQRIYRAFLAIEARGGKIDLLTVTEWLNKNNPIDGHNWAYFVTQLTMNIVSSAHVVEHACIILEKYRLRESIRIAHDVIKDSYEQEKDSEDIIDAATTQLIDLSGMAKQDTVIHASSAVMESMQEIEELMNSEKPLLGIDTGFNSLNEITYGWQDTDLIILAARPGGGKTSLALHFAISTQKSLFHEKKSGLFFSLEMSTGQLMKRIQANLSGIPLDRVLQGKINRIDLDNLTAVSTEIGGMKLHIDDQAGLSIPQIRARAKRVKKKHGLDWILVDYLQLISIKESKGKNRDQVIGEITRGLKGIAKDLNVPIIALSQMNRSIETSGSKRPKLSDLRESGNIEQDASVVMFIHHGIDENGNDMTEIIVEKNRNGKTGSVRVLFDKAKQRWSDMSNDFPDNPTTGITPNSFRGKYLDSDEETPF